MKLFARLILPLMLLSMALPVIAQTVPDNAWTGVTVLLDDGWRYREVTAYLDAKGAGLWVLRTDGAERLVSPDHVVQIIAANGDDVTDRVLAGQRDPAARPPEPVAAQPQQSTEAWDGGMATAALVEEPTAPFKVALTLEGGYVMPAGSWYDMFEPSLAGSARLRIATASQSYLGFGFRYQDYRLVEPIGSYLQGHALMYDCTFGWMSTASSNSSATYFEMGAALVKDEFEFVYDDDPDAEPGTFEDNSGAFVMRTGLMLPFSAGTALDLGLSWIYKGLIFSDSNEASGSLIGIHVGLTWKS